VPRLVAVGSIAYDSLETPFGRRERALGGSAVHFSLAARLFTEVGVVGVVGDDFDGEPVLTERGIDTSGIQVVPGGTTFAWEGRYGYDLNVAETLDTRLGVFEHFDPQLGAAHRDAPVLFLGNIQPDLQRSVRAQSNAAFVALDSMNLWIEIARHALHDVLARADVVLMNDGEIRQYTGVGSAIRGARAILDQGPQAVIVKRGEHGATLVHKEGLFLCPAVPVESVVDPTGAGDSFAGGFVGHLALTRDHSLANLRRATAHGCVVASFTVEDFSVRRLARVTPAELVARYRELRDLTQFDDLDPIHVANVSVGHHRAGPT